MEKNRFSFKSQNLEGLSEMLKAKGYETDFFPEPPLSTVPVLFIKSDEIMIKLDPNYASIYGQLDSEGLTPGDRELERFIESQYKCPFFAEPLMMVGITTGIGAVIIAGLIYFARHEPDCNHGQHGLADFEMFAGYFRAKVAC